MTNPDYRATPEQWAATALTAASASASAQAAAKKWGAKTRDMTNCILELRARIEALEATQHAHIDTSRLSDEKRNQIRQALARPARVFATAEVAPIVVPSSPADSLVERVASAMQPGTFDWSAYEPEARAAILEVAAWVREHTLYLSTFKIAADLEYEANR